MNFANTSLVAIRPRLGSVRRWAGGVLACFALWAAPAFATDLNGIVVDADGQPVPDVPVTLSTSEFMSIATLVLTDTKSDGEGNFRVAVPDRWFDAPTFWRQELSLSARTLDRGNGGVVVYRELPLPRQQLTIQLEPWTKRKITLQAADGKPLAGVRVRLTGLQLPAVFPRRFTQTNLRQLATIPGELQSVSTTDDEGVAELLLPPIESVAAMEAEIEKGVFVNWTVHSSNSSVPKDWSETLKTPALRRLPLRVTFQGSDPSELKLSVTAMPLVSYGATTTVRHTFDLDAAGKTTAVIQDDAILMLRNLSENPTRMQLNPGSFTNSTSLEALPVSFGKGVRVTGRAVSTEGEPAASIRLAAISNQTMRNVSTDASGRFEFSAAPGQALLVPGGRSGYRGGMLGPDSAVVIPPEAETHDLGDLAFTRLQALRGIVRDESGKPVGGAIVAAIWSEPNPAQQQIMIDREEWLTTDQDGTFTIPNLDPTAQPLLAAQHDGAMTQRLQGFPLDNKPAALTIERSAAISVTGRITDGNGNGVGGLEVTLRNRLKPPLTGAELPIGADVEGLRLVTDRSGNYATPQTLPPWGEYMALIRTNTKRETSSGWDRAKPGETLILPVIEDFRTSELTGRVLTVGGKPLGKARVAVLTGDGQTESRSNDDGTFTIDRPAGGTPLLVAEANGFLANGVPITARLTALEIRLPRADQLPLASQEASDAAASKTTDWTVEQKRQLAIQIAEGFEKPNPQTRAQIDSAIARYYPQHILARMDSLPPSNQRLGQMIRSSLANGLAADRPQEGLRILDALPDGFTKIFSLISFERAATFNDDERMQLLARIVQDARGLSQAEFRIAVMGLIGERLIDLGHRENGEALLRESLQDAKQLSPAAFSGYARGAFAEELAQIDADESLALIEPLTDNSEFNRHLQGIAHELASIDPDRAVSILDKMRPPDENRRPLADARELAALRVCYRMIRVEPDMAQQLGRSLKHASLGSHSFGLMAQSLLDQKQVSDADRKLARQLHDEAWRMLARLRQEQDLSEVGYLYPSTIAALLLQQTAKISPDELPHRVWQTIALRRPMEKSGAYQWAGMGCVCEMALLLVEVDPNRARQVASWLPGPSTGSQRFSNYVQYARTAPQLLVELCPDRCEAALETVTDSTANQRLRLSLVRALLRTGDARVRGIRNNAALWFPDDEDLIPVE